jgi:hypothetical protein
LFSYVWVIFTAFLNFQSVSPSNWSVLMKTSPCGASECSMTISAGILSPLDTRTMLLTFKSSLFTLVTPEKVNISYSLEFA